MKRAFALYSRALHISPHLKLKLNQNPRISHKCVSKSPILSSLPPRLRFFSTSENGPSDQIPEPNAGSNSDSQPEIKLEQSGDRQVAVNVEDISNKGN